MADDFNNPARISQQIEQTAGYYDPSIYHERLRTSDVFERTLESAQGFIPFSTAPATPDAKLKLFVIGVIPPSAKVTGRVVDRSASIAGQLSNQGVEQALETAVANATIAPPNGPKTTSSSDFWQQYVCMCNRMGVQPEQLARVLQSESGFSASAKNEQGGVIIAKGLNQLTRDTALGLGMTAAQYDDYLNIPREQQLKWVERYYGNRAQGKDAADLYAINFGAGYYDPTTGSLYRKDVPRQNQGYVLNKWLDRGNKGYITKDDLTASMKPLRGDFQSQINVAKKALGMDILPPPSQSIIGDPPTGDFSGRGAAAVNSAQRQISANSKTDLNSTALGARFAEAQRRMATEVQAAIDDMANTPPLRLLVNPQSFKVSNEKLIADSSWSRNGAIVEHWGDQQDKIEGSGKLGAFYALDVSGLGAATVQASSQGTSRVTESGGPGLTRTARQFSASYQNFLSLYQLYRNNAGIYCGDGTDGGARTSLVYSGSIYIYFDHTLYVGSFDSFSVTEADSAPFTLEYNFSFTVRATFLLDQVPDPKFTYGVSSMNVNSVRPDPTVLPNSEPESTLPYRSMADIAADNADPVVDKAIADLLTAQSKKPAPKGPPARQSPPLPGSLGVPVLDADGNKIGEI
ncbi:hypothetical protein OAA67_04310 [Winogradskyella sp.]|nr:hypothetical protein [Winogradskyella sp.]